MNNLINKAELENKIRRVIKYSFKEYFENISYKKEMYIFFDGDVVEIFLKDLINLKFLKIQRSISEIIKKYEMQITINDIDGKSTKLKILQGKMRYEAKKENIKKLERRRIHFEKVDGAKKLKYDKYVPILESLGAKQNIHGSYETEEYRFNIKKSIAFCKKNEKWYNLNSVIKKIKHKT